MTSWKQMKGKIPYPLTNDYLFRVIVQKKENVLRAILCSALGLREQDITSIRIMNPIIPGEVIDEKEYILDIHVLMNDSIVINIELQVLNYHDWPERSLQYLCRSFDLLNKGQLYTISKTTIHIGILNFPLFSDFHEFFSSFRMMSEKSHRIYTDKFQLYTLCLPNLQNASEEDVSFHRDMWGRYFKIDTWEECRAMAEKYPVIEEAAEEVFNCITNEAIRSRIEAREDYERRQRTLLWQISRKDEQLKKQDALIADKDAQIAELKRRLAESTGNPF